MWSKEHRRAIEWGKNFLILFLTLSALYLMGRSNLGASLREVLWKETGRGNSSQSQQTGQEEQRVWPVRMAVQNESGRYGVQYDEEGLEDLFTGQLGNLLGELLGVTQSVSQIPESAWRDVILSDLPWVYYDFLGSVPLSHLSGWLGDRDDQGNQNLTQQVRSFLVTEVEGKKVLYCYNEDQAAYFRCELEQVGGRRLSAMVSQCEPNGMIFAMENPEVYGRLWPYQLILPELPTLKYYEVSNPLENLEDEDRDKLLTDLSFLPKVATQYPSANGLGILEGEDTLRIQNNGTLTFTAHSTDASQARYPVKTGTVNQAVEECKSILDAALSARIGEARSYCIQSETLEDGKIRVTFGYLLSGAQVIVGSDGWAAEFLIQDGYVQSFTIYLRQYESLEETVGIMPEKQTLAAMNAPEFHGIEGGELLLCYSDFGENTVRAGWFAL